MKCARGCDRVKLQNEAERARRPLRFLREEAEHDKHRAGLPHMLEAQQLRHGPGRGLLHGLAEPRASAARTGLGGSLEPGRGRVKDYKESDPFYHTGAWKRLRVMAIERDQGMCCECMRKFRAGLINKPKRAVMVHHIVPIKEDPTKALRLDNLESLCSGCHEEKHPERRQRREAEPKHQMRVIKV